jgi:hypothetical protein
MIVEHPARRIGTHCPTGLSGLSAVTQKAAGLVSGLGRRSAANGPARPPPPSAEPFQCQFGMRARVDYSILCDSLTRRCTCKDEQALIN